MAHSRNRTREFRLTHASPLLLASLVTGCVYERLDLGDYPVVTSDTSLGGATSATTTVEGSSGGATDSGGATPTVGSAGATSTGGIGGIGGATEVTYTGGTNGVGGGTVVVAGPEVVSVTPAAGTTGVARTATVDVVFSRALAETSVTTQTVTLSCNEQTVATTVSYDAVTLTATLTPTGTLPVLAACTVTVTTGISDEAGNRLAAAVSSSFRVRDCAWGTAGLIESNGGIAFAAQLAVNAGGNATAVWMDPAEGSIYSVPYAADTGWGTSSLVESNTGAASAPQVAMDSSGNAVAVWYQNDGTYNSIYANRYTTGIGWGTASLLEENTGDVNSPELAIDGSGNAVVVWSQDDGPNYSIYSNRYTPGIGWGTASLLELYTGTAEPKAALDSSGNAVVVWYETDGSYRSIYSNRYTAGIGWGTSSLVESNAGDAFRPQIAMDGSGNAVAVWSQTDGTYDSIYVNRYTAGTGWGTASLVEENSLGAAYQQVAVSDSGDAVVVWRQGDGAFDSIYANRFTAGAGWGTASLVETNTGAASSPRVAMDGRGNAVAVWFQNDGSYYSIYANRYTAGAGWGTAGLIEGNTGHASYPQVAMDGRGNAVAVWCQSDGGTYSVYSNRCD